MNLLIFQALCFRLVKKEILALLLATISVALGIALATSVRLATRSARLGLEQNLKQLQGNGWLGPVRASSENAALALSPVFEKFPWRIQRTLDVEFDAGSAAKRSDTSKLVLIESSSSPIFSTSALASVETESSAALSVFAASECVASAGTLRFQGTTIPVALRPFPRASLWSVHDCSIFGTTKSEWRRVWSALGNADAAPLPEAEIYFQFNQPENSVLRDALTRLAAQVPGLSFEPPDARLAQLDELTRSFQVNLQIMGLMGILIGIFMVQHVFSLLVTKNAPQLAILRALGIPLRSQQIPLYALAAGLGVLASAAGCGLGLFLARLVAIATQATTHAIYDKMVDSRLFVWQWQDLIPGLLAGMGATLFGAAFPLWRLRTLPIAQVLRSGLSQKSGKQSLKTFEWFLLAGAISIIALSPFFPIVWHRLPLLAYAAAFAALLVDVLFAKWAHLLLYRASKLQRFGQSQTALRFRIFCPPETAVVVQVLSLGFALTMGVRSMAESFRVTLEHWAGQTLKADLWVRSQDSQSPLDASVLKTLQDSPGAVGVDTLMSAPAQYEDAYQNIARVSLNGSRMEIQTRFEPALMVRSAVGTQSQTAAQIHKSAFSCTGEPTSPCDTYVSESFAIHFGFKTLPHVFQLQSFGTRISLRAVAVTRDFTSDTGTILTDRAVLTRLLGGKNTPHFAAVYFEKPLSSEQADRVLTELKKRLPAGVVALTQARLREQIMMAFENTFRITDALYLLCVAISFFSVLSCLGLQIILRRREWVILWATSALARNNLNFAMARSTALLSALSVVFSLSGGLLLALILVFLVNRYAFGYALTFAFPFSFFVVLLALAAASGFCATLALRPLLMRQLRPQHLSPE